MTVLSGITLEVGAKEVVCLLGPNGAGKSTLLAIAYGALHPGSGEALIDGRPVAVLSRRSIARSIALVTQPGEVRFPLTALEYVLAGRFAHVSALGFDSPADVEIASQALNATDAYQFAGRRFNELSTGERQRVVLARALAQEPRVLLLDEPTANVDLAHQVSLLKLLRSLAARTGHWNACCDARDKPRGGAGRSRRSAEGGALDGVWRAAGSDDCGIVERAV